MTLEIKPARDVPNNPPPRHNWPVYPFGDMKVGEAFAVPPGHRGAQQAGIGTNSRVAAAAYAYGKRMGWAFKVRRQADGGVRVERIA